MRTVLSPGSGREDLKLILGRREIQSADRAINNEKFIPAEFRAYGDWQKRLARKNNASKHEPKTPLHYGAGCYRRPLDYFGA